MTIYRDEHVSVGSLLSQAGSNGDATLVIPDLQRPYVWEPRQVILLMDSLLRGWPFGTLLTWRVSPNDPVNRLARPFYRIVDRTGVGNDESHGRAGHPAEFQMVLDGQQRVQSLLFALGEQDESGFRLLDRKWHEAVGGARPRGRIGTPHWSLGCLCVDVGALVDLYDRAGEQISAVDFNSVLKWVVTSQNGRSTYQRNEAHPFPLPSIWEEPIKYVRLSRLWQAVPPQHVDTFAILPVARELLVDNGFSEDFAERNKQSVAALIGALREVKQTRVNYLELDRYDDNHGEREKYDDAIVNIFTRLNTAGRTLTREDITFAWLKLNWDLGANNGIGAKESIDELLEELQSVGLNLKAEDAIGAVSIIWSASFRGGQILKNADLVRGEVITPMAGEVSVHWALFRNAITRVSSLAHSRSLAYRDQYLSLNALSYLWALYFIGARWQNNANLNEVERDNFDRSILSTIESRIDRWLICSQWAGLWSRGTDAVVASLALRLATLQTNLEGVQNWCAAVNLIADQIDDVIANLIVSPAEAYIESLAVSDRKQVKNYKTALWIWNRLNAARWNAAGAVLRIATHANPAVDVDHIFACNTWQQRLDRFQEDRDDRPLEEMQAAINGLGNCMLLEKNFNISKSNRSLNDFLGDVHFDDDGQQQPGAWYDAMLINENLHSDTMQSPTDIMQAIENRGDEIRRDLIQFVKGEAPRID